VPPIALSTDNAAMIAAAGFVAFRKGVRGGWDLNAEPHLALG
jgi:N6-L-threonylcarbamoyladenine synthase